MMKRCVLAAALWLITRVPVLAEAPGNSKGESATGTGQTNLMPNPDLEEGSNGPAEWTFGHSKGSVGKWSWDSENTHRGKRAFRATKQSSEGYGSLISNFLTVEPGKKYELTAWVKTHEATEAGIYLMVSQYRADDTAMQLPNIFTEGKRRYAVGAWERITLVFTVRDPNTRVRVHAIVTGAPCDVTWDDFALSPAAK